MMGDDRLNDFVRRANRDPALNGNIPAPQRRPSGWVCPTCHTEADQAVEPAEGLTGVFKYLTEKDGTPSPLCVKTQEVTRRDKQGNVLETNETQNCLACFNAWQRRKMMQEIRENVPQLIRKESGHSLTNRS